MQIRINLQDGVPIYLQIANQIKYLIASGRLSPGDELPPIRVLAEQLVVNPNTVARSYKELETAGIVQKRSTSGTYVTDKESPLARRERRRILTERIDALLAEAVTMEVTLEKVIKLVHQRYSVLQNSQRKGKDHE